MCVGVFQPPISLYVNICEEPLKLIDVTDGLEGNFFNGDVQTCIFQPEMINCFLFVVIAIFGFGMNITILKV